MKPDGVVAATIRINRLESLLDLANEITDALEAHAGGCDWCRQGRHCGDGKNFKRLASYARKLAGRFLEKR